MQSVWFTSHSRLSDDDATDDDDADESCLGYSFSEILSLPC